MQRIGIRDFTVRVPRVEEWYPDGLTPEEIVRYISREKSQAVASTENEIVITADTMVFLDDKKLAPHRRRSCGPTSPAANPWTRRGPTACRARARCW